MSTPPKKPSLFDRLTPSEKSFASELISGKTERLTVDEFPFITRYLPMLYNFYTGEISPDEISKYRTIWINEVALNGRNEVEVINGTGTVIAVVPPVYGNIQYIPKDKNFSISNTLQTYRDIKTHRGAASAEAHFKGVMWNMQINRTSSVSDRWEALFKTFNCAPSTTPAAIEPTKDTNLKSFNDDFDVTYEP